MTKHKNPPGISVPRSWPDRVKSATLHVISLAQFALAYTRGWAVNSQVNLRRSTHPVRAHAVRPYSVRSNHA